MRGPLLLVTLLATASACYGPELDRCRVTCADDLCPGGQYCLDDGYCHASETDSLCAASPDAAQPSVAIVALAAGTEHACAVDVDGRLLCWGGNVAGQIGNGSGSLEPVPQPVVVSAGGWTTVEAGGERTCGIRDGALLCWGGDEREPVPADPPDAPPDRWVAVSVGPGHICAIGEIGAARRLWCAGDDYDGELGDGVGDSGGGQLRPIALALDDLDITDWRQVSAGADHTCAVRATGEAYCWGRNGGALGDGTVDDRPIPTRVIAGDDTIDRFAAITAGDGATYAVGFAAGRRYQWGGGGSIVPGRVGGAEDWLEVGFAAGTDATCGVKPGGPRCWGLGHVGQLGDGSFQSSTATDGVAVDGLAEAGLIAAGAQFACFAPASGGVRCWGVNHRGQLGDGTVASKATPSLVDDTGTWTAVAVGTAHSCGVRDGDLYCWGRNDAGQLGLTPSIDPVTTPTLVTLAGGDALEVATGDEHSCALEATGGPAALWCWGRNDVGEVGTGAGGIFAPTLLDDVADWRGLSAGRDTSSARAGIQRMGWGFNEDSALGNDATTAVPTPGAMDFRSWAQVSQGGTFGCGIDATAHVWCWGSDARGQQGTDGGGTRSLPGEVDATQTYAQVAAASLGDHACAIRVGGQLYCWGSNDRGAAGQVPPADVIAPARVGQSTGWSQVAVGDGYTCGVDAAGLYCWGAAGEYQYAPINPLGVHVPSRLGTATWSQVATMYLHSCAITTAGALYCWGTNIFGELGDGTSAAGAPRARRPAVAPRRRAAGRRACGPPGAATDR